MSAYSDSSPSGFLEPDPIDATVNLQEEGEATVEADKKSGRDEARMHKDESHNTYPTLLTDAGNEQTSDSASSMDEPKSPTNPTRLGGNNGYDNEEIMTFLQESASQFISLWTPVTIAIVLTCSMLAIQLSFSPKSDWVISTPIIYYYESSYSLFDKMDMAMLLIGLAILIAVIIIATFCILFLMKNKTYFFIQVYLCITFVLVSVTFFSFWLQVGCSLTGISIDVITYCIIIYNIVVLALMNLFYPEFCPKRLQQLQSLCAAIVVALILTNELMPFKLIGVYALCGALILWDLIAVLPEYGPLRQMVQLAQNDRQGKVAACLRPLVYSIAVWPDLNSDRIENLSNTATNPAKRQQVGSKLGMGDFVFYSFLTASAFANLGLAAAITCYLALFIGFFATLLVLSVVRTVLPALPVPLFFAMIVLSLVSSQCQNEFLRKLSDAQAFL